MIYLIVFAYIFRWLVIKDRKGREKVGKEVRIRENEGYKGERIKKERVLENVTKIEN